MKALSFLILIFVFCFQIVLPSSAKPETIIVGNHTVSMNIPDFPQYYVSSTNLGNEEAIEIKFNESLLRTLLLASSSIQISIYNAGEGSYYLSNVTEIKNELALWGENNYPGAYKLYMKNIAGNPGVVLEHPLSDTYQNLMVLEANSFMDFDSEKRPHSKLYIYSTYDRIVTGAIIDSMSVKKKK